MVISTIVYLLGVLGGISGLIATMRGFDIVGHEISLFVLFTSIALLWVGFVIESIEENYDVYEVLRSVPDGHE
jgi:hypothetical protein